MIRELLAIGVSYRVTALRYGKLGDRYQEFNYRFYHRRHATAVRELPPGHGR